MFIEKIKEFLNNNKAASAIEYGLIAALIATSTIVFLEAIGVNLGQKFDCLAGYISGEGCAVSTVDTNIDVRTGWNSVQEVKAGETYEITFPENLQFTYWNDARRWYDIDDGLPRLGNIGFGATISDTEISGRNIGDANSFDNFFAAENGKVSFTAEKDGFLTVGILDPGSRDNSVTTDGGVTRGTNLEFTVTQLDGVSP